MIFSTSWSACFCSRDLTETGTDASEFSDQHAFTIGNLKKIPGIKESKILTATTFSFICIAIELRYFWRIQSLVIIGDCDSNNSNCKFVLISALNRIYKENDR